MTATNNSNDQLTVSVPVYNGEDIVPETLESLRRQTHANFKVLISVDRSTDRSVDACRPFLEDPRFRLVEQERHLGWVDNCSWLLERVDTEYSFLLPHDDIIASRYIETLLAGARAHPDAAVIYCDIVTLGQDKELRAVQESIRGPKSARVLTYLTEHYNGVAWRGLTRLDALRAAGPIDPNDAGNFAAETVWLFKLLKQGEFVRIAEPLYSKRYRKGSVHDQWTDRDLDGRIHAWQVHCLQMARIALHDDLPSTQRAEIIRALIFRLMRSNPALGPFPEISDLEPPDRERLLDGFRSGLSELIGTEIDGSLIPEGETLHPSPG